MPVTEWPGLMAPGPLDLNVRSPPFGTRGRPRYAGGMCGTSVEGILAQTSIPPRAKAPQ